jgi:hypothetical protein
MEEKSCVEKIRREKKPRPLNELCDGAMIFPFVILANNDVSLQASLAFRYCY